MTNLSYQLKTMADFEEACRPTLPHLFDAYFGQYGHAEWLGLTRNLDAYRRWALRPIGLTNDNDVCISAKLDARFG